MSSDSTNDDVDEKVEPNTPAVSSKSFEFSFDVYSFMTVLIDSSPSKSPAFLTMTQQMVSITSFTDRLEFVPDFNLLLAEFDVCHPRHLIYLILPSLGVMLRVHTALHLPIAHIDNIIRLIAIYNDIYKFAAYPHNILQEFAVDSKLMVLSHPEVVRKLHTWRIDFEKSLRRSASYELNSRWDSGISYAFSSDDLSLSSIGAELPFFLRPIRHRGQLHLHHLGLDVMH